MDRELRQVPGQSDPKQAGHENHAGEKGAHSRMNVALELENHPDDDEDEKNDAGRGQREPRIRFTNAES